MSTSFAPDDDSKRSLRLLCEKLIYALYGEADLAPYDADVHDDIQHPWLWPPVTHKIPREAPTRPQDLRADLDKDPSNEALGLVFSLSYRKYAWDLLSRKIGQKISEEFVQHKDLFLSIPSEWRTPSVAPVPPQFFAKESGQKPRYNTVMELVSDCQTYLWDLQRWDEMDQTTDIDTVPEPGLSQASSELPLASGKRAPVLSAGDFQPRKAPRRRASERRESYFANSWIPSDQFDPPSSQEAGANRGVEENEDENDDAVTIRLGSPVQHEDVPLSEQQQQQQQTHEQTPASSPQIPSTSLVSSPQSSGSNTMTSLLDALKQLHSLHTKSRQSDLEHQKRSIEKESRRKKEDSELRIAHMKKYGYSAAEVEWEEAKMAREEERYRDDVDDLMEQMAEEGPYFAKEQRGGVWLWP